MDTSGQWVQLSDRNARLVVTPNQVGDLLISFQAKSPDGGISGQQDLKVTVTAPSEIAAEALCEAKIVNPAADARIPVQLHIQGVPGADGKFVVTPTVSQGKGKIFLNGYAVNGQASPVDADATFEYAPEEIGEQMYRLDRMMQQLERCGILAKCKAILVGHFSDMQGQKHFGVWDPCDIIATYVRPLGIPVVFGIPAGHEDPNVALYMGREVTVTVNDAGASVEF